MFLSPVLNRILFVCFLTSHNQLSSLPVEVFTLKNLRCLTLQQNLLENLPEELGQLQNLTELVKSEPGSFTDWQRSCLCRREFKKSCQETFIFLKNVIVFIIITFLCCDWLMEMSCFLGLLKGRVQQSPAGFALQYGLSHKAAEAEPLSQ